MILQLKLENWFCHEYTEINFASGMTLLYGQNGAGKTSILNGIYFSLLGTSIIKGGKFKEFVRHGTNQAKINLSFVKRGTPEQLFLVERTIERNGTQNATLFRYNQDGVKEIEVNGPRNVTNRILEIFGAEPGFSQALFLFSEGEIGQYLANSPSQRKTRFHDFLELDKVEKIRKKINKRLNKEKQVLKYKTEERDKNQQRLFKLDKKEIRSLIQEKKNLQNELESLKKELNDFKLKIVPSEEERIRKLLKNVESSLSDTRALYDQESIRERIILRKYNTYNQLLNIRNSISDLNLEVKKLDVDVFKLEKEKIKLITEKEHFESKRKLLLEPSISATHTCPTCEQNIPKKHLERILNEISEKIPNLQKSINNISEKIIEISINLNKKRLELQEALIIKEKIPQIEEIIEMKKNLEDEIFRMEKERSDYLSRLDKIKEKYIFEEKGSQFHIRQRIIDIENSLIQIDKKIEKRKYDQEQVDIIRTDLNELESDLVQIEKKVKLLESVSNTCKKIIERFINSLIKEIKEIFLNIMNRLMNFTINDIKFDEEKFLIILETETGTRDIRYLSGGEKILTYLGFRLALAKYYSNVDFFLFDEPSEHLDFNHAGIIREELFQFIRNGIFPINQVIIAANDSRFTGPIAEEFDFKWDNIYLIEKEVHTSKVTKLEKKIKTLSTMDLIDKKLSTFIDTASIPSEIIDNIRKNLSEGKTIEDKLILGLNIELMFKRLLRKYGINYIEIEEAPDYGIDLIVNLKGETYGVQIKSTSTTISNYSLTIKSQLYKLKSILGLGIDKIIIVVYFFKEKKWMGVPFTHDDLDNKEKLFVKSDSLKPFEEII